MFSAFFLNVKFVVTITVGDTFVHTDSSTQSVTLMILAFRPWALETCYILLAIRKNIAELFYNFKPVKEYSYMT